MLDKDLFFKIKWLIAKNELAFKSRQGGFHYQKPKDSSIVSLHQRVSGIQLGLRAVQTEEMLQWMKNVDVDLTEINQLSFEFDINAMPDIGVSYSEFDASPLSTTVHTALEFMNMYQKRRPVIFTNDFWYFKEIIPNRVGTVNDLKHNDLLIISVPFFETFKVKSNMDEILSRCCDLDIPVMLDLVWLPLVDSIEPLNNTDCVEVIAQSMTKVLPMSGIKGGVAFWRRPVPTRQNMYPLGNNVGFYVSKKYLQEKGYYYVRDSLRHSQKYWCEVLGLEVHDLVLGADIPNNHFLTDQSLHSHRIPNSKIFNLVPFFENEKSIKALLVDKKR